MSVTSVVGASGTRGGAVVFAGTGSGREDDFHMATPAMLNASSAMARKARLRTPPPAAAPLIGPVGGGTGVEIGVGGGTVLSIVGCSEGVRTSIGVGRPEPGESSAVRR